MGTVDVDDSGLLTVRLESSEDLAALAAALRAVPGTDPIALGLGEALVVDPENPGNLVALHAARFTWTQAALHKAVDELTPYAMQSLALHTRTPLLERTMARFRKQTGGVASGDPSSTAAGE